MPVHDWTRVDANLFHDFHQAWTIAIRNALNGGLLPNGYSALVEQHAGGVVPDVIAFQRRAQEQVSTKRANRVAIHHPLGNVVCVLEIVSPGNKSSRAALNAFVAKTVDFIRHGIHLLVVDLFPPTSRDPKGIHKVIWEEVVDQPFELTPDKPLTLAAYVAGIPDTAYVEPVGVGDTLPDMPAYLDPDSYVPVPLEATYQKTWETCPEDMREAVENGFLPGDAEG